MTPMNNPPFIPRWPGGDPIRYCIDASAKPYWAEIRTALDVWGREFAFNSFVEVFEWWWHRTLVFRVADMGPNNPFLAQSMYPPPLIIEPYAGDVTLNAAVQWGGAARPLLLPTLIHEIGHALGMGHFWATDSVMFPNIAEHTVRLSVDDRRMFRCLYNGECIGAK